MNKKINILIFVWTLLILGLFLTNIYIYSTNLDLTIKSQASAFFEQVEISREWNAKHGGVYAKITSNNQPNEYLKVENRDIKIDSLNINITKINPAFMTRQIAEIAEERNGLKFHITSLNPLRTENKADEWEENALKDFESQNKTEAFSLEEYLGEPYHRFMKPLYVKNACLKCHQKQGYKLGDIRGGISVSIPAKANLSKKSETILKYGLIYFIIYIIALLGLLFFKRSFIRFYHRIKSQNIEIQKNNEELTTVEEELRQNNEELSTINESLEEKSKIIEKQKNLLEQEKQKALDASKYKSLFLANMSHEIRTPLNGIIGMADILKETKLTIEQQKYLEIIDISGNNLLSIVNDILDYSKIEANQLELENIPINLYKEIENVEKLLSLKAQSKGLDFSYSIHPDTPKYIKGDALRIKQILINYCNNALKFTEKGFVNIDVRIIEKTATDVILKFSVKDTGMGISKENQAKLFSDFVQVDASTTRKFGGTGLGLSISKKLAHMMGGEVGLESTLGEGSTFWFTGVYDIVFQSSVVLEKQDIEDTESLRELHILLVEDNIINQKVAAHTIKKNGHILDIANDGLEAVEKYKKNKYDLILMDIQMPNMNGYEATHAIREIEKENGSSAVKIVAMTANALKGEREKCLELGMNGYLSKPFKQEALIAIFS